jgi:hypothetical protein
MADELAYGRRALRGEAFTGIVRAARDRERVVRQAVARGELPTYVFGQRKRLKVSDVRRWIAAHRECR